MANHKDKSGETRPASPVIMTRHHKVSYLRQYPDYIAAPLLILEGQWLAVAGFAIGTRVAIQVMEGCLVITTDASELAEPAVPAPAHLLPGCEWKRSDGDKREAIGEYVA